MNSWWLNLLSLLNWQSVDKLIRLMCQTTIRSSHLLENSSMELALVVQDQLKTKRRSCVISWQKSYQLYSKYIVVCLAKKKNSKIQFSKKRSKLKKQIMCLLQMLQLMLCNRTIATSKFLNKYNKWPIMKLNYKICKRLPKSLKTLNYFKIFSFFLESSFTIFCCVLFLNYC